MKRGAFSPALGLLEDEHSLIHDDIAVLCDEQRIKLVMNDGQVKVRRHGPAPLNLGSRP